VAPAGFVTPTTSETEWFVYWAFARIFQTENYRRGPFFGLKGQGQWGYQIGDRELGGAVVDFVHYTSRSGRPTAVRVQTEYWHNMAETEVHQRDALQLQKLMSRYNVVDLYDFKFKHDLTGQAVMVATKAALGLIQLANPVASGVVYRTPKPMG
jgi:hypothetical protein